MSFLSILQILDSRLATSRSRIDVTKPILSRNCGKILVVLFLIIHSFQQNLLHANSNPRPHVILKKEQAQPPGCNCTVSQGSFTSPLPFFIGNTSANAFYSYGVPLGASANTGLEMSQSMLVFLYEDSTTGETSLFIILDQPNDGSGGSAVINFNCLPPSTFVALADDPGEFTGTFPNIVGTFSWASCCTDGGVLGGIGCGHTFTINPAIGSGINSFAVVHGMPGQAEYIYLPDINCPITINCGGQTCCDEAFEISSSTTDASCIDVSDASINLTTTCANTPSFEWSNGGTTEDLSGIPHGDYAVTVTDLNGCSERLTFMIDHGPSPEPEITGPDFFCTGDLDPITLEVSGTFSTWSWSSGENTPTIDVQTAGTYMVTVTDENGCSGMDTVLIAEHPVPEPEITGPSELCPGESITIDVGFGFESYIWSSGQNTQSITIQNPGDYTVTVTNSFGCSSSATTTIFGLENPEPDIQAPPGICGDIPVSLDVGAGYTSYDWSTGENVQNITVLYPGLYYVTVTNASGCTSYDSVFIDPLPVPEPVIQGSSYLCENSSVILDVGSGFAEYIWSNNESSSYIEVYSGGLFQVTVTNPEGCSAIASIDITEQQNTLAQIVRTSCNPADTGVFITHYQNQFGCDSMLVETVLFASRDSVYLFEQSCVASEVGTFISSGINRYGCDSIHTRIVAFITPDTTRINISSCNPLEAGIFVQTLLNFQGCDSIVLKDVTLLKRDTTWINKFTCNPQDTGLFIQTLVNGFGCDSTIYSRHFYSLSDTTILYKTSCQIQDVGITQVTFTGQYGCDSLVITQTDLLPSDTTILISTSCNPNQTGEFSNLHTNQWGCDSLVIRRVYFSLADTTNIIRETCLQSDTGIVVVWLINQYGCDSMVIQQTRLSPPNECTLELSAVHDTIGCKETFGILPVLVLNGQGTYTYSWQDNNGNTGSGTLLASAFPGLIPNLPPGVYRITVRNDEGKEGVITASVYKLNPIEVLTSVNQSFNGQAISCPGASDGQASVQVISGGKPSYNYIWSTGSQNDRVEQLGSGTYHVTISDQYGCEKIDSIVLIEPEPILFDLSIDQPDCLNNERGEINFHAVKGGTPPFLFSKEGVDWNNNPKLDNMIPGNYILHIKDANNCLIDTAVIILDFKYPVIKLTKDTVIELGKSLVISPEITLPGGRLFRVFWEEIECEGCREITVTPNISSDYTIVVVDAQGCEKRAKITVFVKEKEILYFPNILVQKPGGNNHFTVYGSGHLVRIEHLTIYDRWGNAVFDVHNIPPNDPASGWDGTSRGLQVHQGVYVYKTHLLFADGSIKIFTGDITVVH